MTAVSDASKERLLSRIGHRAIRAPRIRWSLSLVAVLGYKNFRTRFKRSFLGVLWVVVQPVLQALVLAFVVVKVFRASTVPAYPLYVLSGTITWSFTQQGLLGATTSIVDNSTLVRKVRVPALVYPASAVGGQLLGYSAPLAVLLVLCGIYGSLSWSLLLLPVAVLLHALFILGFGALCASYYVTYRDINNVVVAGLSLAFYATPILYEISQLPSWARAIVRFNPMTGVMNLYRAAFLGREVDGLSVALCAGVVVALLFLGAWSFRRRAGEFADLV